MAPTLDPEAWHRDGYAVVRGFFAPDEVAAIGAEIDAVHAEGMAHGRSFRHGNLFYKIAQGETGPRVQMHRPESGGMSFVPRSHRSGDLELDTDDDVLGRAMQDAALERVGLSAADAVQLELEPGDLALWNPYLVHGSGTNRAVDQRRFYINGYVRADDCTRGEWAFRAGQPVPLGPEQAMVHYEELRERGEPHYE